MMGLTFSRHTSLYGLMILLKWDVLKLDGHKNQMPGGRPTCLPNHYALAWPALQVELVILRSMTGQKASYLDQ